MANATLDLPNASQQLAARLRQLADLEESLKSKPKPCAGTYDEAPGFLIDIKKTPGGLQFRFRLAARPAHAPFYFASLRAVAEYEINREQQARRW